MIFDRNTINKQGIVSYILVPAIIIRNYPNNSSSPLVQREFLAASLLAAGSTANPRLTLSLLTAAAASTTLLLILECVDDRSRSSSFILCRFPFHIFVFSIFVVVSSAPSLLLSLLLSSSPVLLQDAQHTDDY